MPGIDETSEDGANERPTPDLEDGGPLQAPHHRLHRADTGHDSVWIHASGSKHGHGEFEASATGRTTDLLIALAIIITGALSWAIAGPWAGMFIVATGCIVLCLHRLLPDRRQSDRFLDGEDPYR